MVQSDLHLIHSGAEGRAIAMADIMPVGQSTAEQWRREMLHDLLIFDILWFYSHEEAIRRVAMERVRCAMDLIDVSPRDIVQVYARAQSIEMHEDIQRMQHPDRPVLTTPELVREALEPW